MLRSINQLFGDRLGASDGDIGHVKDFYFDDQNWTIRYLVVDTGSWLPGRQVLLSPYSLGRLDQADKLLRVKLTRAQIENSPSIETHKPVSRQYEEEYHRYYGWPYYWQGDALWGMSGVPILEAPAPTVRDGPVPPKVSPSKRTDAHLHSTQAVNGYQVLTGDQTLGHICDFMMDAGSWEIGQLVVKTGHRFSGKDVLIPTKSVDRISYKDSTVYVTLPEGETAEQNGAPAPASSGPATPPGTNPPRKTPISV